MQHRFRTLIAPGEILQVFARIRSTDAHGITSKNVNLFTDFIGNSCYQVIALYAFIHNQKGNQFICSRQVGNYGIEAVPLKAGANDISNTHFQHKFVFHVQAFGFIEMVIDLNQQKKIWDTI